MHMVAEGVILSVAFLADNWLQHTQIPWEHSASSRNQYWPLAWSFFQECHWSSPWFYALIQPYLFSSVHTKDTYRRGAVKLKNPVGINNQMSSHSVQGRFVSWGWCQPGNRFKSSSVSVKIVGVASWVCLYNLLWCLIFKVFTERAYFIGAGCFPFTPFIYLVDPSGQ